MKIKIEVEIEGDEKENALLKEIFEKGNLNLLAEKWAEFQEKVCFIQQKRQLDNPHAFWAWYRKSRKNAGGDDGIKENK